MLDTILAELSAAVTSATVAMTDFAATVTLPVLPPTEVLIACGIAALIAAVTLVSALGPFLAVTSEYITIKTKRAFFARAARQIAQMSLTVGILATVFSGGGMAWLISSEPLLLQPPYLIPLTVTGGCILITLALLAVYARQRPGKPPAGTGHAAMGFAAGSFAVFSLFCCIGIVRRLLHTPPDFDLTLPPFVQLRLFFEIPSDSFFWPLLLESVPLGFALAAASACVWLLLMRERQDYGRDYYAFALPYCAKWALGCTFPAVLAGVFVFMESQKLMLPELSHEPSLLLDILSAALPLLACIFWIFVIRSAHPMRHKISVVLAWLLLLAGFAGQVLMLNKVIPSP